jgi:hypothetical protein
MSRSPAEKLNNNRGISRLAALLLVLIIVMSAMIAVPHLLSYNAQGEAVACAAALDTASRRLAQDYLDGNYDQNAAEAQKVVTVAMNGWDDLCPGGGKVYLVETKNKDLPYELVCGKHDHDAKRRTRLNSGYVLEQLKEGLRKARRDGKPYPEKLVFSLNGKQWTARLTDEATGFKRGTATTAGMEGKGIVAYYAIAGHSDFCADSGAKEGSICYFSFADEQHCANWRYDDGWTGDSYGVR